MTNCPAETLFALKYPVLQRAAAARAARLRMRPEDAEDLAQASAMLLWLQARRMAGLREPVISCERLVISAAADAHRRRRGTSPGRLLPSERPTRYRAAASRAFIPQNGIHSRQKLARHPGRSLGRKRRAKVAREVGVSLQRVATEAPSWGCLWDRPRRRWVFPGADAAYQ
jgi:hypothetical protein